MKKLSDADWKEVFRLRCKSKRGDGLSRRELAFCERALREDPERYSALDEEVFYATRPAVSVAEWRKVTRG